MTYILIFPERIRFDKLFGAGGALVLELSVVLHLVSLQLVQTGHHSTADGAGYVHHLSKIVVYTSHLRTPRLTIDREGYVHQIAKIVV